MSLFGAFPSRITVTVIRVYGDKLYGGPYGDSLLNIRNMRPGLFAETRI